MTPNDLARLRRWCGLSDRYVGFNPVESVGDCAIVEDKLLSEGWSVRVNKNIGRFRYAVYSCTISRAAKDGDEGPHDFLAEAPSRREAIVLCALGVCP
jgi:hypothetical protein